MLSYMVLNKNLNIWTSKLSWIRTNSRIYKMTNHNIRWAFNASAWKPTKNEILAASSYIQPEEKLRISKYVFQNDAKSSLIGRLLLRKFVHVSTGMPYADITFSRDARGKPYLLGAGDRAVNYNISHQGDYVVLAGNSAKNIGIDVMKIEPPANKNIPEFFRLMTRQFSKQEWLTIRSYPTEMEQVACFYRLWCLKESYVKNIGLGITIPLIDISFNLKTLKLSVGEIITDTVLYEMNVLKQDWVFEETLLDERHAVAVSLQMEKDEEHVAPSYTFLTFEDIVKEAKPITESDEIFSDDLMKKKLKNF